MVERSGDGCTHLLGSGHCVECVGKLVEVESSQEDVVNVMGSRESKSELASERWIIYLSSLARQKGSEPGVHRRFDHTK